MTNSNLVFIFGLIISYNFIVPYHAYQTGSSSFSSSGSSSSSSSFQAQKEFSSQLGTINVEDGQASNQIYRQYQPTAFASSYNFGQNPDIESNSVLYSGNSGVKGGYRTQFGIPEQTILLNGVNKNVIGIPSNVQGSKQFLFSGPDSLFAQAYQEFLGCNPATGLKTCQPLSKISSDDFIEKFLRTNKIVLPNNGCNEFGCSYNGEVDLSDDKGTGNLKFSSAKASLNTDDGNTKGFQTFQSSSVKSQYSSTCINGVCTGSDGKVIGSGKFQNLNGVNGIGNIQSINSLADSSASLDLTNNPFLNGEINLIPTSNSQKIYSSGASGENKYQTGNQIRVGSQIQGSNQIHGLSQTQGSSQIKGGNYQNIDVPQGLPNAYYIDLSKNPFLNGQMKQQGFSSFKLNSQNTAQNLDLAQNPFLNGAFVEKNAFNSQSINQNSKYPTPSAINNNLLNTQTNQQTDSFGVNSLNSNQGVNYFTSTRIPSSTLAPVSLDLSKNPFLNNHQTGSSSINQGQINSFSQNKISLNHGSTQQQTNVRGQTDNVNKITFGSSSNQGNLSVNTGTLPPNPPKYENINYNDKNVYEPQEVPCSVYKPGVKCYAGLPNLPNNQGQTVFIPQQPSGFRLPSGSSSGSFSSSSSGFSNSADQNSVLFQSPSLPVVPLNQKCTGNDIFCVNKLDCVNGEFIGNSNNLRKISNQNCHQNEVCCFVKQTLTSQGGLFTSNFQQQNEVSQQANGQNKFTLQGVTSQQGLNQQTLQGEQATRLNLANQQRNELGLKLTEIQQNSQQQGNFQQNSFQQSNSQQRYSGAQNLNVQNSQYLQTGIKGVVSNDQTPQGTIYVSNTNLNSRVSTLPPYINAYLPPIQTTKAPEYLPPPPPSTKAPEYLPPDQSGSEIESENLQPEEEPNPSNGVSDRVPIPTTPRPVLPPRVVTPYPGCPAAMKCTPIEFCASDGVISNITVFLTPEQNERRVPLTDCTDVQSGLIGKCCRDPNYVDPWPAGQLGLWNPDNGFDDGQYRQGTDGQFNQRFPDQSIAGSAVIGRQPLRLPGQLPQFPRFPQINRDNSGSFIADLNLEPLPSASGSCGVRHPESRPRGNGPIDAAFGEIPWQAMILLDTNRSLLCGGAIIRNDAVLTAAHCVDKFSSQEILVKGGEWRLGIDEEPKPFQIAKVAAIVLHPQYNQQSLQNDLAILFLAEQLRFDSHISPLCIPPEEDNIEAKYAQGKCIITGWGKEVLRIHISNSLPHILPVNLIEPNECQYQLSNNYPEFMRNLYSQKSCICGETANRNHDICDVDPGSALACDIGNGQYAFSGVLSWDTGCKSQKGSQLVARGPQIASFVRLDVTWILSELKKPLRFILQEANFNSIPSATNLNQVKVQPDKLVKKDCECKE